MQNLDEINASLATGASRHPRHVGPFLTRLRACVKLSNADERALEDAMKDVRQLPAGTHLAEKGDRPHFVHILLDGWAARYQALSNGSRSITAFLLPGDLCDQHVTVLGTMDHSIVTLTRATVAYIPNGQLEQVARSRPDVAQALWWSTLVDEAVLRAWLVNVGRRGAFEAIAHLLCELNVRLAKVGLSDKADFSFPVTQEEIADSLGLTPVYVNKMLQRLRKEGYISLKAGKLAIIDLARLEAIAGFDPVYLHAFPVDLFYSMG